jgi:DeoR/GlpR family transcriptional regulator of sugar metabolism
MKAEQRRFEIMALIGKKNMVTIKELSSLFDINERTIRRDLNRLTEMGFLKRVYGGAEADSSEKILFNITLRGRKIEYTEDKRRIGEKASDYVQEGQTLFVLGGTTTLEFVKHLPKDIHFRVITNFSPIAEALTEYENIEVHSTGGILNHLTDSFYGPHAEALLQNLNIDSLFLGCSGVSLEKGLSTFDFKVAPLMIKAMGISKKKILLVDSHKFQAESSLFFAPIEAVDILITDSKIDPKIHEALSSRGVQVVIVP